MAIISGSPMPTTAKTIWNPSEIAICNRAASRLDMETSGNRVVCLIHRVS